MNGLPPDFDAAFLVGLTLIQVCVGENEVVLHFADDSRPPGMVTGEFTTDVVVSAPSGTVRHVEARSAGAVAPGLPRSADSRRDR